MIKLRDLMINSAYQQMLAFTVTPVHLQQFLALLEPTMTSLIQLVNVWLVQLDLSVEIKLLSLHHVLMVNTQTKDKLLVLSVLQDHSVQSLELLVIS
jgi:hypothetical protein